MRHPPTTFTLPSAATGTRYRITCAPPNPAVDPGPWPVVVVLDADDQFAAALDGVRALWSRGNGRGLLLAGVGYGASYRDPANRRVRDYTPTPLATEAGSGGAAAFHQFLVDELWPRLAREYPVSHDSPGLAGHSLGALFGLFALFRPRPFFTSILASAPSLWWDDRSLLRQVDQCRAEVAELPARLFLGVGDADTDSMRGDLDLLEAQLAKNPFPALRIASQRFPHDDHSTVLPRSYREGLRALYGR